MPDCHQWPWPSSLPESPFTIMYWIDAHRLWFQLTHTELQCPLASIQRASVSKIKQLEQKQRWHTVIHTDIKVCSDAVTASAHFWYIYIGNYIGNLWVGKAIFFYDLCSMFCYQRKCLQYWNIGQRSFLRLKTIKCLLKVKYIGTQHPVNQMSKAAKKQAEKQNHCSKIAPIKCIVLSSLHHCQHIYCLSSFSMSEDKNQGLQQYPCKLERRCYLHFQH